MNKHPKSLTVTDQNLDEIIRTTERLQPAGHLADSHTDIEAVELAVNQARYTRLFDNMLNGCAYYQVLFDEAGSPVDLSYVNVNSVYAKIIGRPRIELIGKQATAIFPHLTEASCQWLEAYMALALSGEPVAFTQYFDYQEKWYSIAAYSPQQDYIIEILEDITERKQGEVHADQYIAELAERNLQLKAIESRYRGLLEHMNSIFEYYRVLADTDGRPIDLEFADANPAFEVQTGFKTADVAGKRFPGISRGMNKAYWIQVLGNVALTGQPVILEHYLEAADTWYRVSAYSPEPGYVASIFEDITERKKAEVQKSENQRRVALIEKMASLGSLAIGVAHEINQPLQALKILADGMIYWYDKGTEPSMEKIMQNCRRISIQAGYITGILEWMQDSVNRTWSHTPTAVDLNTMIKQAVTMVQERVRVHSIQLHKNNLCTRAPIVWGDVRRLEEIVIIILVNAIESLNSAAQPIKKIVITTSCAGKKAIIEISNNGPAIPDDIIDKIFEPFFTSSKPGAKLGMGLTIVKSILNDHNATIKAANLNRHVTFRMEFPLYIR